MSKCKFLFSLVLSFLLLFGSFSVNAFASDNTNLVSSDLSTWELGSSFDSTLIDPNAFYYNSDYNYSRIRIRFPSDDTYGYAGTSLIFDLPSLDVGVNYQFSFSVPTLDIVQQVFAHIDSLELYFGENVLCQVGVGYIDYNNDLVFYDNCYTSITVTNLSSYIGYNFVQSFKLDNIVGQPVFAIRATSLGSVESYLFFQNLSLTRVSSESDKKLDGILGWLQELWSSIIGGFDRVQNKIGEVITNISGELQSVREGIITKLGEVITNISGELQSVREGITTKLGEVITGLTGELRFLGDKITNSIRDFFIPSPDYFENLSYEFRNIAEERFGALFTVVDFIDSFLFSFDADKTTEYIDIPVYQFDIFGYTFPFGGWRFRFIPDYPIIHDLVDIAKGVSNIIITFTFIGGLKSRYDEIFGGD